MVRKYQRKLSFKLNALNENLYSNLNVNDTRRKKTGVKIQHLANINVTLFFLLAVCAFILLMICWVSDFSLSRIISSYVCLSVFMNFELVFFLYCSKYKVHRCRVKVIYHNRQIREPERIKEYSNSLRSQFLTTQHAKWDICTNCLALLFFRPFNLNAALFIPSIKFDAFVFSALRRNICHSFACEAFCELVRAYCMRFNV